jgi:hypothetical protein
MNKRMRTLMKRNVIAILVLLALVAVLVPPRVQAQPESSDLAVDEFIVNGVQASSSSPFLVKGNLIGNGVWQQVIGPVLSGTLGLIPGTAPSFGGAGCQAEYSQGQIETQDGSVLTFNVYGVRCKPYATPGAYTTIGAYSVAGGTGRFRDVTSGTGTVTIDSRADGSASIHIGGFVFRSHCSGGKCGD